MHELGIVFSIADTVEKLAKEYELQKVASITLQVGELSGVVPKYLEECYPAAVDKSKLLHDTKLKIEIMPADFMCHECGKVFTFKGNHDRHNIICPSCGCVENDILSGTEFIIKEIEGC